MQVAETKTSSAAQNLLQTRRSPFFNKEGRDGFFSNSNESSTSFFNLTTLQAKLTIGQPNDKYEVEADAMADKVVQRLSNHKYTNDSTSEDVHGSFGVGVQHANLIQTKCAGCEEEEKLQKKQEPLLNGISRVQRKSIFESDAEPPDGLFSEGDAGLTHIRRKCASFEEEEKLQTKPLGIPQIQKEDYAPGQDAVPQPKIDWLPINKVYFDRGLGGTDSRDTGLIEGRWRRTYDLGLSLGLSSSLAEKSSNILTPLYVDAGLSHDNPTIWDNMDRQLSTSSIIFSPTVLTFDLSNIGGTIDSPLRSLFGGKARNPYPNNQSGALQRKSETLIHRKCTSCGQEDELQKTGDEQSLATPSLENRLASTKGTGSPLPENTRYQMESSFDADFGRVRIHSDGAALKMSRDLQAQAFTHGKDIYFNSGKFDTNSVGGKHLLAHELTHVMQQDLSTHQKIDKACLNSPPCPAPGSSAPIPGSAEDFNTQEDAAEVDPRARRSKMSCSRATSSGHAGRALQLENLLQGFDPALRSKIHGIFIDADMSQGTGAFVDVCSGPNSWEDIALPLGCTVPQLAGATKPCVFVHGNFNQEAFQFNRTTNPTIGGLPREDWRIDTIQSLIHEVQHTVFDSSIAGRAVPAAAAGCPRASVDAELTELNAILSEFPIVFRAIPAAPGPARTNAFQRLNDWFDNVITNPSESLAGTLKAMRCTCNCNEVDAHARDIFNFVSSSWTVPEKNAFNNELRRAVWNVPPINLNWPL